MAGDRGLPVRRVTDARGHSWRVGTDAEVAWIVRGTSPNLTITAAIPPVFDAYATIVLPDGGEDQERHNRAMLTMLAGQSPGPPARPRQAATWRRNEAGSSWWRDVLPDLMFPADRSWLVSTLCDDDWTCVGGPASLVDMFLAHPDLQAQPVLLGEEATPPGHQAF